MMAYLGAFEAAILTGTHPAEDAVEGSDHGVQGHGTAYKDTARRTRHTARETKPTKLTKRLNRGTRSRAL